MSSKVTYLSRKEKPPASQFVVKSQFAVHIDNYLSLVSDLLPKGGRKIAAEILA